MLQDAIKNGLAKLLNVKQFVKNVRESVYANITDRNHDAKIAECHDRETATGEQGTQLQNRPKQRHSHRI